MSLKHGLNAVDNKITLKYTLNNDVFVGEFSEQEIKDITGKQTSAKNSMHL
jgi:hypothetical protein